MNDMIGGTRPPGWTPPPPPKPSKWVYFWVSAAGLLAIATLVLVLAAIWIPSWQWLCTAAVLGALTVICIYAAAEDS